MVLGSSVWFMCVVSCRAIELLCFRLQRLLGSVLWCWVVLLVIDDVRWVVLKVIPDVVLGCSGSGLDCSGLV